MKPKKVLEIVLREMTAIGTFYRNDWSDFDGRTLRNKMDSLSEWATLALKSETDLDYTEDTEALKKQSKYI